MRNIQCRASYFLPFVKYFYDDKLKEKKMDGIHTRSTHEEMINVY